MKKALDAILYSNSFYGLVAIALAIENNLVLHMPLNHPLFYILLFCSTVAFYLLSYRYDSHPRQGNKRALWIFKHRKQLTAYQTLLLISMIIGGIIYWYLLPPVPMQQLIRLTLLLSIFPLLGILYYGVSFPGIFKIRLRSFGWFKPFIIGAVWAGTVSFIPWILFHWMHQKTPEADAAFIFFGLHNWMFISILAILFDIKDFAADHNQSLKTFVVRRGLRYVIFVIVIPLCMVGIMALSVFFVAHQTRVPAIVLFLIPMVLLCRVAIGLSKRRTVAWYLLVIDGLMLVKALCGIAAMGIG